MKNIISIILGILMFLKLMELLYGAIFLDKPLNPITKIIFILTLIYIFYVLVKELIIFLKSKYNKSAQHMYIFNIIIFLNGLINFFNN